jgi:hypothetical protein
MSTPTTVDEIVTAIKGLGQEDRDALVLQLAMLDDLIEDLEDVMDLLRSEGERERPFEEFIRELEARRGNV